MLLTKATAISEAKPRSRCCPFFLKEPKGCLKIFDRTPPNAEVAKTFALSGVERRHVSLNSCAVESCDANEGFQSNLE
jgi:hypothetical protein